MAKLAGLLGLMAMLMGMRETFALIDYGYDQSWDTFEKEYDDDVDDVVQDERVSEASPLQRYYTNLTPIKLDPYLLPKARIEKKKNRIPLHWRGQKNSMNQPSQNQLVESLYFPRVFSRMKPKLGARLQNLKLSNYRRR